MQLGLLRLEELFERLLKLRTKFRGMQDQIHGDLHGLLGEEQDDEDLLNVHFDDGWRKGEREGD